MDARQTYRRWLLQLWHGDAAAADVLAIQRVISSYPALSYGVGPAEVAPASQGTGPGKGR